MLLLQPFNHRSRLYKEGVVLCRFNSVRSVSPCSSSLLSLSLFLRFCLLGALLNKGGKGENKFHPVPSFFPLSFPPLYCVFLFPFDLPFLLFEWFLFVFPVLCFSDYIFATLFFFARLLVSFSFGVRWQGGYIVQRFILGSVWF